MHAPRAAPDRVVLSVPFEPSLRTAGGVLHGGVLVVLADLAGAVLAHLSLPDDARCGRLDPHAT